MIGQFVTRMLQHISAPVQSFHRARVNSVVRLFILRSTSSTMLCGGLSVCSSIFQCSGQELRQGINHTPMGSLLEILRRY